MRTAIMAEATPRKREWSAHMWDGMDYFPWYRLLAQHRFAVSPKLWYLVGIVSCVSFGHMVLRWVQNSRYGRQIAATPIRQAPIFLIGHWRTGTTHLHELMILDERFSYPNTYHCLDPNHFLLTEHLAKRYLNWMLPDQRPMDNMAVGWDRPQEDEFALCMLGQPSPYLDFAFPNQGPAAPGSLDLDGLTPGQLRDWKRTFRRFLQTLTFKDPRRLVLKSPPHTARIRHLLDLFPDAQFVHIMRDPYVVFSSTVHLWKKLYRQHALQTPTFAGLEEHVLQTYRHIYDKLEEAKPLIPAGQFHELKYEDLVARPVAEMERIYDALQLGGFETYQPRLQSYLDRNANYETNRYELSPEWRARVRQEWGAEIDRYGYE